MNKELGIYLVWGRPGMGKSLDQARTALKLFAQYKQIQKKYPQLPHRTMWSNQKFNDTLEKEHLHKDLFYWENPRQLKGLRDVDILWDEIGKDLPGDSWRDTPKWLRQLFSHYRKRGNRIYANTQDYKSVDINFRRMIKTAWRVKKVIGNRDISVTMPAVKNVWGIIKKQEFDPIVVEQLGGDLIADIDQKHQKKFLGGIKSKTRYFLIKRKYVNAYDTTAEIPPYMPDKFEHHTITCEDPKCGFERVEHKKI